MKKGTIVGICVVVGICLAFVISYKVDMAKKDKLNAMLNETYDNAILAGGEMLKKEFPELINDDSDFIGYELNGIWHVQNYVKDFNDIESIRYVKFKDEDFDEILLFGNLQTRDENVDPKCEVKTFDDVFFILRQISYYKYDYINNQKMYFEHEYANSMEIIGTSIPYMINVRNKDGMILYFGSSCG